MEPITLYRRAIRSGRMEMMSEVAVRLSTDPANDDLVKGLVEQIFRMEQDAQAEHPTPAERARAIWKGQ